MDLPASASEPRGAAFLELLESKHDHVLTELDALNERIEQVLNMYANRRTGGGEQENSSQKSA